MHGSRITIIVACSLALGALASGCGVQSTAPKLPTYEADVKPILVSRCVRCHGANNMLNDDPDHGGIGAGGAPFDGFFNRLDDDCPDAQPLGCHGLRFYTTAEMPNKAALFTSYITSTADSGRMPPPPSPPLTSRQIDVLLNWQAEAPDLQ